MAETNMENELVTCEDDVDDEADDQGGGESSFRDSLQKPELFRAIVDCGFEHPSEGTVVDNKRVTCKGDKVDDQAGGDSSDLPVKKKMKESNISGDSSGFRDSLLKPERLRAIEECGFKLPSEVEHKCLSQAMLGKDILCQARSVTERAAVFVLATLQQLEPVTGQVSVLVICNDKNLFQVFDQYKQFSKYMPSVKVAMFYEGPSLVNINILEKSCPHIVVGTPGQLFTLATNYMQNLNLEHIKHFILDECNDLFRQKGLTTFLSA